MSDAPASAGFATLVVEVAGDLAAQADLLNRLDAVAGDGDLGVTVTNAAAALREAAPAIAALPTAEAVRRVGTELARRVPSTGGTLVAFAFMAAGRALAAVPDATGTAALDVALAAAAAAVAERGRVAPGDKTMLDALAPAAAASSAAAAAGAGVSATVRAAAAAADAGAAATATMRATTGRAGWLAERAQGSEDAGARLVAMALAATATRLGDGRGGS